MSVKTLRKQLFAAIAMVLVAAIALGSSTYAWFVSNNTVTATTSNISAQSNSAYLVIDKTTTSTNSTSSVTAAATTTVGDDMKVYPATIVKDQGNAIWKTGYAGDKNLSMISGELAVIGANGTAEQAKALDYNLKNTFNVGTGTYDGEFTDLTVAGLEVNIPSTSDLISAIRVYVEDSDQTGWAVLKPIVVLGKDAYKVKEGDSSTYVLRSNTATEITADEYNALDAKTAITSNETKWEIESSSNNGIIHATKFGQSSGNGDVVVNTYVYYDGSDPLVYTTNLENLDEIGVTITFTATPKTFES